MEYYSSTSASDQSESWRPQLDASQTYPTSHFQKLLGNIPLIEGFKENGILIFVFNKYITQLFSFPQLIYTCKNS